MKFEPSAFIAWITGVYALWGANADNGVVESAVMPAPVAAWISDSPVTAPVFESLLYTYAPCNPLCCLARYVNTPWFDW